MAERKGAEKAGKRERGRPSQNQNDVGRKALLDAATKVLHRVDPARITRKMVAEEAEVDPNLIRYYFGNLEHLLMEVTMRINKQARKDMAAKRDMSAPSERLRFKIDRTFHLFGDNPHHHKLIVSMLDAANDEDALQDWCALLTNAVEDTADIVAQGEQTKSLRAIDPRFLHIFINSICEFWTSNPAVIKMLFGSDSLNDDLTSEYIDFVYDVIMNGISRNMEKNSSK